MFLNENVRTVPPFGSQQAKIALIGEAPGDVELREGEPFRGPAGGILTSCLQAAAITRSECYITNLFPFKVKKKGKDKKIYLEDSLLWDPKKGFSEEGMIYVEALKEELERISANVLVPLGNPAFEALCPSLKGITKWRGSILESELLPGRKTIPSIHPSAALQSGDFLIRYYIVFDLRRVKKEKEVREIILPEQKFIYNLSLEENLAWLEYYRTEGRKGHRVNFDIEIINLEISCISFATELS